MNFKSELKKIEEYGDKAFEVVKVGREIAMGIAGIVILAAMAYVQFRFKIFGKILEALVESDQYKDPTMWWVYFFPYAFVGVWIFGALYMIFNMVATIISVKKPYGRAAITLAYVKSLAVAIPFVLAGLLFMMPGVGIIIVSLIKGEYIVIGMGLIVELMGLGAFAAGVTQIVSNTLAYRDYNSTGGVSFAPSKITIISKFASENLPVVIGGGVFSVVPFALIGLALTTPDMDGIAILVLVIMGLVFGAFGVFIISLAVRKFKEFSENYNENDTSGDEEDYHDLSLK